MNPKQAEGRKCKRLEWKKKIEKSHAEKSTNPKVGSLKKSTKLTDFQLDFPLQPQKREDSNYNNKEGTL